MNVVLLGPPGSGKGTQAARLSVEYGAPAIASGDILRAQRDAGTRLGLKVRRYMDSGELVPDVLVIDTMRHRLQEADAQRGFLLDGFPRTVAQGQALDAMLAELGRPIDRVLYLEVGRQALLDRLGHRYICPTCGAVYSLTADQANATGTCSRDGAPLDQRSDDRPEIIAHRIDVFLRQTAPLIDYYQARAKLVRVDADRDQEAVYAAMVQALGPAPGVSSVARA